LFGIQYAPVVLLLAGVLILLAASAAQADDNPRDFIATQVGRSYTEVPREVLAFYYPWYGTPERHGHWVHWDKVDAEHHDIGSARHYPAKGAYDSYDPQIVDWHIGLAKSNGITGFIASWWGRGTFEDADLPVILDRAAKADFKISVYWETAPGKGEDQIAGAVQDLVYLVSQFGTNRAFLKVKGKPVIFVYGRVLGEVPMSSWPAIMSEARAQAGDFLLIADGYRTNYTGFFDGLHTYNIAGRMAGKNPDTLRATAAGDFAGAVKLARSHGRISCLTVIPGYDDTKIRKPGLKADRADGQTYRILWDEAIKAKPDWVLITSWNEWHEGSEIEPSIELGDEYINITREFAPGFRDSTLMR
jgi:hypothetical protein